MSYGQAVQEESVEYHIERSPEKKKKIGFLKRWLLNSLKDAVQAEQNSSNSIKASRPSPRVLGELSINEVDLNKERAIRFNVYVANGGRVVETSRYDRTKDRHQTGLYIISDTQDFGREIDKIIVMEGLK